MADGKPGRRPHPAPIVALVEELLAAGLSTRAVVAELARQNVSIGRITVRRIQAGTYLKPVESTGRLAPGESALADPERCPDCGGQIRVKPCRKCRVKIARALLDRYRQIHAAKSPPPYTTSRPRGPFPADPTELAHQLAPDQAARLEQIRTRRDRGE